MLTESRTEVNTTGYVPGSLDQEVRRWAQRYWPDARYQDNWQQYRAYYRREWMKEERYQAAREVRST